MSVLSAKVMNNQISYFSKIFGTLHLNHGGKKNQNINGQCNDWRSYFLN